MNADIFFTNAKNSMLNGAFPGHRREFPRLDPSGAGKVDHEPGVSRLTTQVFPPARPPSYSATHDRLEGWVEGLQGGDRAQIAAQNLEPTGVLVQEPDQRFNLWQLGHADILAWPA